MSSYLTLITTDIEGEEYDYDCIGYEHRPDGTLRVFVDGQSFVELEQADYGGGPLVLIDYINDDDTVH